MIQTRLLTEGDLTPWGMSCPYCDRILRAGDEIAEELTGMVHDIPMTFSMCAECGSLLDSRRPCGDCQGTGEMHYAQCPTCGGAGDLIPGRRSANNSGDGS